MARRDGLILTVQKPVHRTWGRKVANDLHLENVTSQTLTADRAKKFHLIFFGFRGFRG